LIEEGMPVSAAVYDAHRQEFFHAVRGEGAYLNGSRIEVSQKTRLYDSLLLTSPPGAADEEKDDTERCGKSISRLLPEAAALRMLGSVALQLAYIACGRADVFWEYGEGAYDWMAGILLIQEAGGAVMDIHGQAFDWGAYGIIAGNDTLCSATSQILSA
jgi:myo-inositol-1(or 4)-monophosphatase